jgi:hypothetical protein
VIELRFHKELYRGESVDSAIKAFDRYAKLERAEEPTHWIVRVEGSAPAREKRVARELSNWALGETIRDRAAPAT